MENSFGSPDGRPTQRTIDYFEARAKGGVALITLGASAIDAKHKEVPASLHFADDAVIEDHRALTEVVHAHGAKIQPQIAHAGPDGLGPEMHRVEALGPSGVQSYLTGTTSKPVTVEEFRAVVLLVDVEGLTYGEAAEALGCPVGTVRSRLSRARRGLFAILSGGVSPRYPSTPEDQG